MGWTGVQYSLFRAGLAVAVAHVCWTRMALVEGPAWPLFALGLLGSVALALGWRDRAVAINLLWLVGGLAAIVDGAPLELPETDVMLTAGLLLLHLFTPVAPFGSWDARNRVDPRGDWTRSNGLGHVAWVWLALIHLERAWTRWMLGPRTSAELDPSLTFAVVASVFALFQVGFAVATFAPSWRPAAWSVLTLWQIAWIAAFGCEPGTGALLLLHAFAADPGWWPGRTLQPADAIPFAPPQAARARLFYDGNCGFCHRSVRIILSEETNTPEPLRLRFAPLQGELFAHTLAARDDIDPAALPDSIVLVPEVGGLLTRSAAALEIASRLGGLWRGLALAFGVLPSSLLDRAYDGIARIRKRLFANPKDACPILPPDLRKRFDL